MSVSQTHVDHLLSVQLKEAVAVLRAMKSPLHICPLNIPMVALVSTFIENMCEL